MVAALSVLATDCHSAAIAINGLTNGLATIGAGTNGLTSDGRTSSLVMLFGAPSLFPTVDDGDLDHDLDDGDLAALSAPAFASSGEGFVWGGPPGILRVYRPPSDGGGVSEDGSVSTDDDLTTLLRHQADGRTRWTAMTTTHDPRTQRNGGPDGGPGGGAHAQVVTGMQVHVGTLHAATECASLWHAAGP